MRTPKNAQGKGESMAGKGNENAPEAAKKAEEEDVEGSAHEAAKSPESGPLGGDEVPGHAPMGEATKNTTRRSGRKSTTSATRRTPRATAATSSIGRAGYAAASYEAS
jgi:hypothetical protein